MNNNNTVNHSLFKSFFNLCLNPFFSLGLILLIAITLEYPYILFCIPLLLIIILFITLDKIQSKINTIHSQEIAELKIQNSEISEKLNTTIDELEKIKNL